MLSGLFTCPVTENSLFSSVTSFTLTLLLPLEYFLTCHAICLTYKLIPLLPHSSFSSFLLSTKYCENTVLGKVLLRWSQLHHLLLLEDTINVNV